MNLDLLDPKVIVLAAVLIVVALCWFGIRTKSQANHCRPAAKVRLRV